MSSPSPPLLLLLDIPSVFVPSPQHPRHPHHFLFLGIFLFVLLKNLDLASWIWCLSSDQVIFQSISLQILLLFHSLVSFRSPIKSYIRPTQYILTFLNDSSLFSIVLFLFLQSRTFLLIYLLLCYMFSLQLCQCCQTQYLVFNVSIFQKFYLDLFRMCYVTFIASSLQIFSSLCSISKIKISTI